ncbi:hypothetical protein GFL85_28340 [Rhizobium laguerreae]|nr:hypothetical protein [Rhizobium laguerreae]
MTRSGPSKPSDARHGANRLIIARGFLESAKLQISSAQAGTLGNARHRPRTNIILNTDIMTLHYQIDHFLFGADQHSICDGMLLPAKFLIVAEDVVPIFLNSIPFGAGLRIKAINTHSL